MAAAVVVVMQRESLTVEEVLCIVVQIPVVGNFRLGWQTDETDAA